ncbi:hypothetical protein AB834_02425 [PVC group bacterium (ex Bugula neritina AB1)]|nr:hypothetical protein AB834_02425 [PVC group bacterium (ex Bugula neritina AB1)]
MFKSLLKIIFGTKSQRDIKKLQFRVDRINEMEKELSTLSDETLKERSLKLKDSVQKRVLPLYEKYEKVKQKKLHEGLSIQTEKEEFNKSKESLLDEFLEEAFAIVREAGKRILNMRHYDVQLMGAIVLHQGKIAEMTTGEGKTLVATLSVYLNALTGKGVHVVTVNDYLAERDRNWMGPLYEFLGLTVGVIVNNMNPPERKEAYACDITFGTNNEYGFDYLRDNMVMSKEEQVQRSLNYCVVDEVDSILIDEARTPLIISGPVDKVSHCYMEVKPMVQLLVTKQEVLLQTFYKNLDECLQKDDDKTLSEWLYIIHRGAPKDPNFLQRISQQPELKRKLEKSITFYSSKERAKERVTLEEKLFYIYDEKSRDVILSSTGEELLSSGSKDLFQINDIADEVANIQADESLSSEEKKKSEIEAYKAYETKGKQIRSFEQLLKAYILFHLDVDYVVDDDKVVIVDEFTGRMMPGRRFSDGLHEALEAKENVQIQRESQTLATITFQNYFRMYHKLSGMTGTADTEAGEFYEIYKLDVVVVPTNKPMQRKNFSDIIYKTSRERYNAVVTEVNKMHLEGRPILVGTASIESSERVSKLLNKKKIIHEVLNAKNHAREAEIIAMAGQQGSVTIATNMAGRGTDIVLGDGVMDKGGLHVIGTERHDSRRIDNQLRGRAGRQGDPGSSRFFLSFEDDLMRIFGSDRIATLMERLHMKEGEDIQSPLVTRAIETAQRRVEAHNFDIRKWLLKYDNVMNKQREVIYTYRQMILEMSDLQNHLYELIEEIFIGFVQNHFALNQEDPDIEEFDAEKMQKDLLGDFRLNISLDTLNQSYKNKNLDQMLYQECVKNFEKKVAPLSSEELLDHISFRFLNAIDQSWKDHLYTMDELRESVGLRAYGQIDPLHEYQKEGHRLFSFMFHSIKSQAVLETINMPIMTFDEHVESFEKDSLEFNHSPEEDNTNESASFALQKEELLNSLTKIQRSQQVRQKDKVGRNEPCPCGSSKKYKKCCGS